MKEITIVTAFFSLGGSRGRTDEQYLSYFKKWAKLKNRIICYVESDMMKQKILDFRDSIGLLEKTYVIIINDFLSIDSLSYQNIKSTMDNKALQTFITNPESPCHSNPKYNYVMLLKSWCCQDASQYLNQIDEIIAWVDFGFNHEDCIIDSSSNFNYHWEYDFPDDKITIFPVRPLDNRPLFDIVLSGSVYLAGTIVVAPCYLWKDLWEMMRNNMARLNACGLCDSDETVLLMCYRESPNLFNLIQTDFWGEGFRICGGQHLIPSKRRRIEEKDMWFFKAAHKQLIDRHLEHIGEYWKEQFYII